MAVAVTLMKTGRWAWLALLTAFSTFLDWSACVLGKFVSGLWSLDALEVTMVTIVIDTRALCHLIIFFVTLLPIRLVFLSLVGIVMVHTVNHWNNGIITNTCFRHIGTFPVNPFSSWNLLLFAFLGCELINYMAKINFYFCPLERVKWKDFLLYQMWGSGQRCR